MSEHLGVYTRRDPSQIASYRGLKKGNSFATLFPWNTIDELRGVVLQFVKIRTLQLRSSVA